jgi:superfamily I DNA and/or RNA helicase
MVLQQAAVVFCTVSTCASFLMRSTKFEIGIIDEAAQCIEVFEGEIDREI